MQTNNALLRTLSTNRRSEVMSAVAQKTIKEGNISTTISAKGFTTTEGDKQLCVSVRESDPDESDTVFEGCGPAQRLTMQWSRFSNVWWYSHRFRF